MKRILLFGLLLAIIPLSFTYAADPPLDIATTAKTTFSTTINNFLNGIVNGNNEIRWFSWAWLIVLAVLAVTSEFANFASKGLDLERVLMCGILVITTTYLCSNFLEPLDVIWQTADAMSLGFLEGVTGNRDPLYLTKWLNASLYQIVVDDPSLMLGGVGVVMMAVLWNIAIFLISFVMYLVGVWATWGFVLSKLLAMIFIPCLVYEPTRGFFDAYFKFFLGFVILLIVMRITGSIAAITIQSQFQTLGLMCFSFVSCAIREGTELNSSAQFEMIITCFICSLLVASSFKFAYELSSSCGSASGGAVKGLSSLIKKGLTKL